jgi:hypothetical protein
LASSSVNKNGGQLIVGLSTNRCSSVKQKKRNNQGQLPHDIPHSVVCVKVERETCFTFCVFVLCVEKISRSSSPRAFGIMQPYLFLSFFFFP